MITQQRACSPAWCTVKRGTQALHCATVFAVTSTVPSSNLLPGVQVAMVRVLHAMGGSYQDAAARVLTSLLDREPGHPGALAAYAMMAAERGMPSDAVRVLLSLLVQRPEDTAIRCSPGFLLTASSVSSLKTRHPLCALAAHATLAAEHSIACNAVGVLLRPPVQSPENTAIMCCPAFCHSSSLDVFRGHCSE